MDTKTSFIEQMSDSISRLILPKNFYDLRYIFPKIAFGIEYQEFFNTSTHCPQKIFPVYKFQLLNYLKNILPCIAHFNRR